MGFETLLGANIQLVLALVILWILPWKGYALWLAARNNHRVWFVVLLVVNTLAILEIIYIFAISRRTQQKEVNGLAEKN